MKLYESYSPDLFLGCTTHPCNANQGTLWVTLAGVDLLCVIARCFAEPVLDSCWTYNDGSLLTTIQVAQ